MNMPPSSPDIRPLVGRERELAILRRQLDAALAGHGSVVLIGGEAGIGKTALAETLCRDAVEQGVLVLIGRCYDLTETPPYGPWLELLGRYRRKDRMPALPDAFSRRESIGEVTSQGTLFQQGLAFLTALAATRPLVLLLEDVHWADPASLDLLRFVARNLTDCRLLILVTYRSDEILREHPLYKLLPALLREAHAERLDLRALDDVAVGALVHVRYGLAAPDTDRLVTHLQARAEGNPLFLGELLRSCEEMGVLRDQGGEWTLGTLGEGVVPPLLRQVIDARLAHFDGVTRQILALAAMLGQTVSLEVWSKIAEVEEERLLAVVAEAEAAHVMVEDRDGTGATFTHALVREALYEGIRPSQRRRWHGRAGDVLAASPTAEPDTVADHFRRAGDGRAVEWLIAAGERAASAYAWATAADRFEVALGLMEPDDTDAGQRGWLLYRLATLRRWDHPRRGIALLEEAAHLAALAHDAGLAAYAAYTLGALRCVGGQMRLGVAGMESGVAARRALTTEQRDRARRLSLALSVGEDANGEATLVHWLATVGRYAEARALGEGLDIGLPDVATDTTSDMLRAEVLLGLAQVYAGMGMVEEARRAYEWTRDAYRGARHDFMFGMTIINEVRWTMPYRADHAAELLSLLAEAEAAMTRAAGAVTAYQLRSPQILRLLHAGRWSEARHQAMLEWESPRGVQSTTRQVLGPLAHAQGDTDLALELVRVTLPQGPATEPGDVWLPCGLTFLRLAATLVLDGADPGMARECLETHDRWVAWSGSPAGRADGDVAWATYYHATGDDARARAHAERALAAASAPRQPLALLAAHRALGELDTVAGRFDAAAAHLTDALALADACVAPYERALTLVARAEMHAATGQRDVALRVLAEARSIAAPLGAAPLLARATTLAARLDAAKAPAPAYPAGLSEREVEVLRLVAAGRTNEEIAATLSISRHTVIHHVTHILTKTQSDNRVAAAAYALRHNLV